MIRVVVTGIGAVTPLSNTFAESWQAILSGISGIGTIAAFDTSELPWKVAGEVKDFDAGTFLGYKEKKRLDPFAQYAVAAAVMAAEDSGYLTAGSRLLSTQDSLRNGGVIIGSSRGGISTIEKTLNLAGRKAGRLSPYLMPSTTISMAASYIAMKLGIHGYCLGISNACSSGTNAIGEAYRLVRHGYAGPILAGGAEAPVCRLCVEGYGAAGALSRSSSSGASRPFDLKRDGFVLSEGACVLMLESLDQAIERGSRIYGEITGYGNTVDAFHQTRPDPSGEAGAIIQAVSESGISPDMVDYVNTHGTSTRIGDQTEAEAIKMVFGDRAKTSLACSATKSMTGHMLAASGAFEAACTLMTLKDGIIPPSMHLTEKDPDCSINIITKKSAAHAETAITSSFGFGGVNAVLMLRKFR